MKQLKLKQLTIIFCLKSPTNNHYKSEIMQIKNSLSPEKNQLSIASYESSEFLSTSMSQVSTSSYERTNSLLSSTQIFNPLRRYYENIRWIESPDWSLIDSPTDSLISNGYESNPRDSFSPEYCQKQGWKKNSQGKLTFIVNHDPVINSYQQHKNIMNPLSPQRAIYQVTNTEMISNNIVARHQELLTVSSELQNDISQTQDVNSFEHSRFYMTNEDQLKNNNANRISEEQDDNTSQTKTRSLKKFKLAKVKKFLLKRFYHLFQK